MIGFKGIQGDIGVRGNKGERGDHGIIGDKGEQGIQVSYMRCICSMNKLYLFLILSIGITRSKRYLYRENYCF